MLADVRKLQVSENVKMLATCLQIITASHCLFLRSPKSKDTLQSRSQNMYSRYIKNKEIFLWFATKVTYRQIWRQFSSDRFNLKFTVQTLKSNFLLTWKDSFTAIVRKCVITMSVGESFFPLHESKSCRCAWRHNLTIVTTNFLVKYHAKVTFQQNILL